MKTWGWDVDLKKCRLAKLLQFLFVLFVSCGAVAGEQLFESPLFGDSAAYIKSWIESSSGFKSLAAGTKAVEQVFSRDTKDWRLNQIKYVNELIKIAREKRVEAIKKIEIPKKHLESEVAKLRAAIKEDANKDERSLEFLKLYTERLRVLSTAEIVWASLISVIEEHLSVLQHHSDDVVYMGMDLFSKIVYRLDEQNYIETQLELAEDQVKEVEEHRARIARERSGFKTSLTAIYKDILVKERELKEYKNDVKSNLLEVQYDLLKDREMLFELRSQKSIFEKNKLDEELGLLKFKRSRIFDLSVRSRRTLAVDSEDVSRALTEKEEQDLALIAEKARVESLKNEKDIEYEQARQRYEATRAHLANLRAQGKELTSEILMLQAKEMLEKNQCGLIVNQVAFLDLDVCFSSAELALKHFNLKSIEARFRLSSDDFSAGEWTQELRVQKKLFEGEVRDLVDRKNKANASLPKLQEELDRLRKKQLDSSDEEKNIFLGHEDDYKLTMQYLFDAKDAVKSQVTQTQNFEVRVAELIQMYNKTLKKYHFLLEDLEARRISVDIWRRSSRGLSIATALKAVEELGQHFQDSRDAVCGLFEFRAISIGELFGFFTGLFVLIASFVLSGILSRALLVFARRRLQLFISYQKGTFVFWYLNVLLLFLDAVLRRFSLTFFMVFFAVHLRYRLMYFGTLSRMYHPFLVVAFGLIELSLAVFLSYDFIFELRVLNARLSYFFFSEKNQRRTLLLLNLLFYSSAIALPLHSLTEAFAAQGAVFPTLIFAFYSFAVTIVLAFFFEKDDFLNLVSGRSSFFIAVRQTIDDYFYPAFTFFLGVCLLANPYIGYASLAWYLAIYVPISLFIIWASGWLYGVVRGQVFWLFIEERDDELVERFEHAKVYYGYFVTLSFFALAFFVVGILSKTWGFGYTYAHLWHLISEDWVIRLGKDSCVGILELFTLYAFVVGGYLVSTIINKFILTKVFEVFGAETGAQNTFSRIFHFVILIASVMFGFIFIGLAFAVIWLMPFLVLVGGFGAKDLVADFVAGLLILLERQIEIGHFITAENTRGVVHKISARSTIIRTSQNHFMVIPNRTLISHPIINWGVGRFSVGFELMVTVGYEADPEVVVAILRRILNSHALVLRVPAPTVRVENFSQHGVEFFLRGFVSIRKVREQWEVASDVRMAIYKAFREKGIVFPYPRLVMYQKDTQPDDANSFFKIRFDESPEGIPSSGR